MDATYIVEMSSTAERIETQQTDPETGSIIKIQKRGVEQVGDSILSGPKYKDLICLIQSANPEDRNEHSGTLCVKDQDFILAENVNNLSD